MGEGWGEGLVLRSPDLVCVYVKPGSQYDAGTSVASQVLWIQNYFQWFGWLDAGECCAGDAGIELVCISASTFAGNARWCCRTCSSYNTWRNSGASVILWTRLKQWHNAICTAVVPLPSNHILPMSMTSILFNCGTKHLHDGVPSNCMMQKVIQPHTQAQKSAWYTRTLCAHARMCPYTNDIVWECPACSLSVMEREFAYTLERIGCSSLSLVPEQKACITVCFWWQGCFCVVTYQIWKIHLLWSLAVTVQQVAWQRQQTALFLLYHFSYGWPSP